MNAQPLDLTNTPMYRMSLAALYADLDRSIGDIQAVVNERYHLAPDPFTLDLAGDLGFWRNCLINHMIRAGLEVTAEGVARAPRPEYPMVEGQPNVVDFTRYVDMRNQLWSVTLPGEGE